jgi:hypothetical protein
MIHYLVTDEHQYTVGTHLPHWPGILSRRIRILTYETLTSCNELRPGTYIFSDLDRLSPVQTELCLRVWDQLRQAAGATRLLNHPRRILRRYELLRTLHTEGQNLFRAYRLSEDYSRILFPVFVRRENGHEGSLTPLLSTRKDLDVALLQLFYRGHRSEDLLIVEFCDTAAPDGIFRKYSAFRIGDQILPRRLIFNLDWMAKNNTESLINEQRALEEKTYLETNPHENWLREVFDRACIEYGRIDYSFHDGRPQVWEINTNPTIFLQAERYHPLHLPLQELFATKLAAALEAVDLATPGIPPIKIRIPTDLLGRITTDRKTRRRKDLFRHLVAKGRNSIVSPSVVRHIKPYIARHASLLVRIFS